MTLRLSPTQTSAPAERLRVHRRNAHTWPPSWTARETSSSQGATGQRQQVPAQQVLARRGVQLRNRCTQRRQGNRPGEGRQPVQRQNAASAGEQNGREVSADDQATARCQQAHRIVPARVPSKHGVQRLPAELDAADRTLCHAMGEKSYAICG